MTARLHPASWLPVAAMATLGVLLGLAAVLSPLLAIGGAVAVAFVGLVMADLTVGVALFAFVAFLEVVPGLEGLSASKLAGALLVFSWLVAAATQPGSRAQLAGLHPGVLYLGLALLAWMGLSALWSKEPALALEQVTRLAPNFLLLPIVFAAMNDRRAVPILLGAFVVGTCMTAVYGSLNPGDADSAAADRLSGAGVDANYLASTIVASLALCGGVLAMRRAAPWALRAVAAVVIALLVVALILTASRTGFVALGAALVAGILVAGRRRRLTMAVCALVALGAGALVFAAVAPPEVKEHFETTSGGGTGRTDIWTVGLRLVEAHPIVGVGSGNFRVTTIDYLLEPGSLQRADLIVDRGIVAHNIYLEFLAELGIVGFLLYFAVVGYVLNCSRKAAALFARAGDRPLEMASRAVFVATVAMLAAAAFNSLGYQKTLWLMFALGPALYGLAVRTTRGRTA